MADFQIGGITPVGNSLPSTSMPSTPDSMAIGGDRCTLPARFDVSFSRFTELLLSHLDMDAPKPQRNMDLVKTAVDDFHSEMATIAPAAESGSMLSRLSTLFGGDSMQSTNEYHALSRLYATVYSQFPDEANLHIDHDRIDQLNHDLWNGGRVSRPEVNDLHQRMAELLGELLPTT
ncbi:hypothetical protein EBR57_02590 [bacterium]|nr:hypothetical protein [bacterium]